MASPLQSLCARVPLGAAAARAAGHAWHAAASHAPVAAVRVGTCSHRAQEAPRGRGSRKARHQEALVLPYGSESTRAAAGARLERCSARGQGRRPRCTPTVAHACGRRCPPAWMTKMSAPPSLGSPRTSPGTQCSRCEGKGRAGWRDDGAGRSRGAPTLSSPSPPPPQFSDDGDTTPERLHNGVDLQARGGAGRRAGARSLSRPSHGLSRPAAHARPAPTARRAFRGTACSCHASITGRGIVRRGRRAHALPPPPHLAPRPPAPPALPPPPPPPPRKCA